MGGLSLAALAAGCLSLLAAPAYGAVVNVASSLDVSAPGGDSTIFVYRDLPEFAPTTPVAVAEGDTLIWTIDFKGDQQLTALGLFDVSMFLIIDFSDPASVVGSEQTSTGKVEFLGSDGEALFASDTRTTTLGNVHVGQEFYGEPLSEAPTRLSFFGIRYTGVVEDYLLAGLTSRTYDDPAFSLQAKLLLVGPDTGVPVPGEHVSVPEPATWGLLLLGFALSGAAVRRRRVLLS